MIKRSDDGNKIDGNIIMVTTIGNPITVGVMNEANRFSFILILKGFLFLRLLVIWMKVMMGMIVRKFLIEIR